MHPRLESINRIILSVGHGGLHEEKYDPGAVNALTKVTENNMAKDITFRLASYLTASGLTVILLPDYGLGKTISYINSNGDAFTDWAFEIHKDSSVNFTSKLSRRIGVYYHPTSDGSAEIANKMAKRFTENGAKTGWAWPDSQSNHGTLAWIRKPKMLSHIIEAGFMQDDNSPVANNFYAHTIADSICFCLERPLVL